MAESPPVTAQSPEAVISFEQYLKQYDGTRAEWVAGKVNVHMAPSKTHQLLLFFLAQVLGWSLSLKQRGRVMVGGFPMYTGPDKSAREPDLLVIFNEHLERLKATYLDGVADIVVEIVSPESVERDYGTKFKEYEEAGVPEYWLIDPQRRIATVYVLDKSGYYHQLPLDSAGRLVSSLLPDFALGTTLLWLEEPPEGIELLRLVADMTGVDVAGLLKSEE